MQVDELIRALMATGTMNEDTTAELNRMLGEYQAGTLDPEDEAYLRALHARVTESPLPEPEEVAAPAALDGLTLAEWRDRALAAEAELAALRAGQAADAG